MTSSTTPTATTRHDGRTTHGDREVAGASLGGRTHVPDDLALDVGALRLLVDSAG